MVVLEKTLESPLDCKEIQPVHPKGDQSWVFIGGIDVEAETPVLWPPDAKSWLVWKTRCWERLRAGGEGDDRGWDGWMASSTPLTWVWVNSGSWWWTGRPGMLQSMGLQRVGHDWATELNWTGLASQSLPRKFGSIQKLRPVQLFATPWTAERQASMSITNSRSPPKPMSIESVMPSNHL